MVTSVNKYGGFYVARYEAGDGDATSARTAITDAHTVVSKKGAFVYNYVPWNSTTYSMTSEGDANGAIKLSHSMYSVSTSVVSHLIYGCQWDAIMYFATIEGKNVSDSRSWGNHSDSTGEAAVNSGSSNMNYTTGRNKVWQTNNIYDIAGNLREWTMEAYSVTSCVIRSGGFVSGGSNFPASFRNLDNPGSTYDSFSFRPALYIK